MSRYLDRSPDQKYEKLIIRTPHDLWALLKKAAFTSDVSMNKIIVEMLEAKRGTIERKYISKHVDKAHKCGKV